MDIILSNDKVINVPADIFRDIRRLKSIGKGSYGEVFEYVDRDTKFAFAIKHISIPSENLISSQVRKEIEINRKVNHEHVVKFYNVYLVPKQSVSFVLEFMANGSLKQRLNDLEAEKGNIAGTSLMDNSEILRMSYEVAKGLRYLHNEKIIHRDIRSANILLTSDDTCKLGDFGISAEINFLAMKSGFSTIGVGNVFWQAPEMMVNLEDSESEDEEDEETGKKEQAEGENQNNREEDKIKHKANDKVDVWSLGILILEMIHNVPPHIKKSKSALAYQDRLVNKKKAPVTPKFAPEDVKKLLGKCLQLEPDARSSAAELTEFIRGVYTPQEYDLFLSHNWGNDNSNHNKVAVINEELRRRGYRTWFDEEQMPASTFTEKAMSRGISHSKVFILFLTKDYMTKVNGNAGRGVLDNCYLEFKYAIMKKTPLNMVTVVLEREMLDESKWQETFAMHMSKHIYLNMCEDLGNQNAFKTNMDILCESLDLIIQRQGGAIPRSKTVNPTLVDSTQQLGIQDPLSSNSASVVPAQGQRESDAYKTESSKEKDCKPKTHLQSQKPKENKKIIGFGTFQEKPDIKTKKDLHPKGFGTFQDKSDIKTKKDLHPKGIRHVRLEALKGRSGTPPKPRRSHLALYDGEQSQLLIFGGISFSNQRLSDLHIYNNNKGTYTQAHTKGEIPSHTCLSRGWLRDGCMFVLGGGYRSDNGEWSYSNSLHSYNCESGEWMRVDTTGDVPPPRSSFILWQHKDTIVVFGGYGEKPTNLKHNEQYDEWGGGKGYNNQLFVLHLTTTPPQWSRPTCYGQRPSPRSSACFTQITTTGYVFGGSTTHGYSNELFALNLDSFTWQRIENRGDMVPSGRSCSAMVPINEHELFICGGYDGRNVLSDLYRFDITSQEWEEVEVPNFPPTYLHTLTYMDQGQTLLFGGLDKNEKSTNTLLLIEFI